MWGEPAHSVRVSLQTLRAALPHCAIAWYGGAYCPTTGAFLSGWYATPPGGARVRLGADGPSALQAAQALGAGFGGAPGPGPGAYRLGGGPWCPLPAAADAPPAPASTPGCRAITYAWRVCEVTFIEGPVPPALGASIWGIEVYRWPPTGLAGRSPDAAPDRVGIGEIYAPEGAEPRWAWAWAVLGDLGLRGP